MIRSGCLALLLIGSALAQPDTPAPTDPPKDPPAKEQPPEGSSGEQTPTRVRVWVRSVSQPLVGELISRTDEEIVLDISGVRQTIPLTRVERIAVEPSIEELFQAMKASVPPEDAPMRLVAAKWVVSQGRYDLALTELSEIVAIDPHLVEAQELLRQVKAQIKLLQQEKGEKPSKADQQPMIPDQPPKPDVPLLTEDDINLIRVILVDLADPPRMRVEHDDVARFLDAYPTDPPRTAQQREAFIRQDPAVILKAIFEYRAREFYNIVKIQDDPEAMKLFRKDVQRWLVNRCGSTDCHGGAGAAPGNFKIVTENIHTDAANYTNFLILERFTTSDGRPMIDYVAPERSGLLQLALPRDQSTMPHPEVLIGERGREGWRPHFRSEDERGFGEVIDFINALYRPRPEYPIEYPPNQPDQAQTPEPESAPR